MGLCLYVFSADFGGDDEPDELAFCDVGHYSDFGCFRDTIADKLDARRYPVLMQHSDCDGEWSVAEIDLLERELAEIASRFKQLPPQEPTTRSNIPRNIVRMPNRRTIVFTTSMATIFSTRSSRSVRLQKLTGGQSRSCNQHRAAPLCQSPSTFYSTRL